MPQLLFGAPSEHAPRGAVAWSKVSKRDALCYEHLAILDAALCRFYREHAHCAPDRTPAPCAHPDGEASFRRVARDSHAVLDECANEHDNCPAWAKAGECTKNPAFMHSSCAASCGSCEMTTDAILRMFGDDVYHLGDWRW